MDINQIPVKQVGSELTHEEFNTVVDKVKAQKESITQIEDDIALLDVPIVSVQTGTTITLGGIPKDTVLYGKNAVEVIEKLLYQELFPTTISAPTYEFSITPSGLIKVGTEVNIVKTRSFSPGSISPQYQSASSNRSGALIDYTETGNEGSFTVVLGASNWTSKANYGAGVQPKGSNGTPVPGYGPLPAGSTAVVTRTITGVYPVLATTSTISSFSELALLTHGSDIEVTVAAESSTQKQTVKIPEAWGGITRLDILNPISKNWDAISLTTFTKTETPELIGGVNYTVYTHNGVQTAQRRLRFRL